MPSRNVDYYKLMSFPRTILSLQTFRTISTQ